MQNLQKYIQLESGMLHNIPHTSACIPHLNLLNLTDPNESRHIKLSNVIIENRKHKWNLCWETHTHASNLEGYLALSPVTFSSRIFWVTSMHSSDLILSLLTSASSSLSSEEALLSFSLSPLPLYRSHSVATICFASSNLLLKRFASEKESLVYWIFMDFSIRTVYCSKFDG